MKKLPTTILVLSLIITLIPQRINAQSSKKLKEAAFTALESKNYDLARQNFKQLIIQFPDSAKLLGMCYNNLGFIDIQEEFNARAIENFELAQNVYENYGNDSLLAICLINNASIFKILGQYEKATSLAIRSLKIFEQKKMILKSSQASNVLGNIYKESNNLEIALKYHNRALELAKELNDSIQVGKALNNRGGTF